MRNEINKMLFEGNEVEVLVMNGEVLFEIYSLGSALGYSRWTESKGKKYFKIEKSRIDTIVKNAEISTLAHNGQTFITEPQLYDFMLESRTNKCKSFRKWVTEDVLPSIRKDGGYIDEDSTMKEREALKLKPMSMRAITKSIHECEIMKLEQLVIDILEANINSGKRGRVNKQLRDLDITEYKQHVRKHIRHGIESKPYSSNMRDHAIEIAIRDRIIIDLLDDIQETTNRSYAQLIKAV